MPEITPDRIKAYLDDLALVSAKHGLALMVRTVDTPVVEALDATFAGYRCQSDGICFESIDTDEVAPEPIWEFRPGLVIVGSLDISTITAHQRIALERSLADTKEQTNA